MLLLWWEVVDSLFCGKATPVAACIQHAARCRLSNQPPQKMKRAPHGALTLVGGGGFEPPKSLTTDLQSAPFGHSGNLPYSIKKRLELVDGLEPPTC